MVFKQKLIFAATSIFLSVFLPTVQAAPATDLKCNGCVDTRNLDKNAINSSKIKNGQVKNADIAKNAITSAKIRNGQVKGVDLSANSVSSEKIRNGGVKSVDLAADSVTESKLSPGLRATIKALQSRIAALEDQVATQQQVLQYFSLTEIDDPNYVVGTLPYTTIRISGANLQIVNGTGTTNTENGTGNLIVGYNATYQSTDADDFRCSAGGKDESACLAAHEIWSVNHRSGSHNIVTGNYNNYSSYGGLLGGAFNTANRQYASVTGGAGNTASGDYSSVTGGLYNTASGYISSLSGGKDHTASGSYSSISGGLANTASGSYSSISGGRASEASGEASSVSGGNRHTASGRDSAVSGGFNNSATSVSDTVSGGWFNTASGGSSTVAGGQTVTADSYTELAP